MPLTVLGPLQGSIILSKQQVEILEYPCSVTFLLHLCKLCRMCGTCSNNQLISSCWRHSIFFPNIFFRTCVFGKCLATGSAYQLQLSKCFCNCLNIFFQHCNGNSSFIDEFPSNKPPLKSTIFQPSMLDDQGLVPIITINQC